MAILIFQPSTIPYVGYVVPGKWKSFEETVLSPIGNVECVFEDNDPQYSDDFNDGEFRKLNYPGVSRDEVIAAVTALFERDREKNGKLAYIFDLAVARNHQLWKKLTAKWAISS